MSTITITLSFCIDFVILKFVLSDSVLLVVCMVPFSLIFKDPITINKLTTTPRHYSNSVGYLVIIVETFYSVLNLP